jgi:hypothetical protein
MGLAESRLMFWDDGMMRHAIKNSASIEKS